MASLIGETTVTTSSPGIVGKADYTWSGNTLTVTVSMRTNSQYGWANDPWSCSATVDGNTQSGDIKGRTSGTIGTTWYSKSFSWTVSGASKSVSVYWSTYNRGSGTSKSGTAYSPYVAPSQTFVTQIKNNTSGAVKNTGDKGNSDQTWLNTSNTNYAGDSLTMTWDKNSPGNVGVSADPTSRAFFTRDSDNNQDTYSTLIYQAWDWTGGGNDQYVTYDYTISVDDCNSWLKCMMHKSFLDSGGTRNHYLQGCLEYVNSQPSVSGNITLRSKRFYTGTPSCAVWQMDSYSTTNNGYGMSNTSTNDNSQGYKNNNTAVGKFCISLDTGGHLNTWVRWGSGAFNANYSLPTPLSIHTTKRTVNGTPDRNAVCYTNWFNPRTGATGRLGYKYADLGATSIVSGSVTLPTIDEIKPVSGNGTTAVVDSTKHVWTNQSNVQLVYKVTHSGNTNGFGYDARVNENDGTHGSSSIIEGSAIVPVNMSLWSSPYGVRDHTSDSVTIQHDSMTTSGSVRTIAIVPYIRDSANYQIFGAANTSNGLVTSTPYTLYLIQKPGTPTINKWSNTLPAIDGVKDRVQWEITSPSSFGNVTDFTTGFKLKYRIGSDKTRSDGYEWYFTEGAKNTSTKFNGYFDETYNRSLNTVCDAMVAATNRYDTVWNSYLDFQGSFTSASSYNITAKTPYNQTSGTLTMDPSNGNHTTLATEVPFIFTCPNQSSLNATDLVRTTKMTIDSGTPTVIDSPAYALGSANSLTGLRNVTWTALKTQTPALARGAHTLKIECEVLSYFKSTTPIENNVYLGACKVESSVMNIEVAEMPQKPTMKTPSPAYYTAGQERTMTFPWTTNDWGCLDTTNNNRHFDYQLINPKGTVISSGTIAKDKTSWSYTFTPNNNDLGTYTFKLRETTVVGSSDYSTQTFEIQKAVEPAQASIETSQIIALDDWNWDLSIKPGSNGSFKPVTSAPITRYKVDIIHSEYNMYKPDFSALGPSSNISSTSSITALSNGWYKVVGKNTTGSIGFINFFTKFNSHIKADTTYTYVMEVRNVSTSSSRNIGIQIGKTNGMPAWMDYNIDDDTHTQIDTFAPIDVTSADTNRVFFQTVKTKKDMKSLGGSNYSTPTDTKWLSRDYFNVQAGDDWSLEFRVSLIEGEVTASDFSYKPYVDPFVKNIVGWTNAANTTIIKKSFTHNLGEYTDGTYSYEITYERYYTTKTTADIYHTQIIPPEINISDLCYIVKDEITETKVPFMLNIEVFASTISWNCSYSIDYGKTWVNVPLAETDKAKKYFRKKLDLKYNDFIMIKAYGNNPVDEESYETNHEMPSSYKVWLSWADRDSSDKYMLHNRFPRLYSTKPSYLDYYRPQTGDKIEWDNHALKFSTGNITTATYRGFYIGRIGEQTGMKEGTRYKIELKIRSTQEHDIKLGFEPAVGGTQYKNIDVNNKYQTVSIEGVYTAGASYKALTFYSTSYGAKERVYVKDIKITEIRPVKDVDVIRRLNVAYNGQASKKLTYLRKK